MTIKTKKEINNNVVNDGYIRKDREITHTIPGSADAKSSNHHIISSGAAGSESKLSDQDYCKKEANELYQFLINYTPAGIFQQLVSLMVREDIKCNNYYAELLGFTKTEIYTKAKHKGII